MGPTDSAVVTEQYRHSANLAARITLHERFSTNPLALHRWLFAQMELPSRARLLEVGCGLGSLWRNNLDRLPPEWSVVLTDVSPGMVREAAERLGDHQRQFNFAEADARALTFANSSFDAVLAHFMLYYIPHRDRALREIVRVLRPDGVLYAATNGHHHMQAGMIFAIQSGLLEDAGRANDATEFGLENGAAQLTPWFADVAPRRYDDALVITDPEPLLAYILSGWDVQATIARHGRDEAQRTVAVLRTLLDQAFARHGQIHVSKDSGLFIARDARRAG
jgi:SAM-dependent methyltransferase